MTDNPTPQDDDEGLMWNADLGRYQPSPTPIQPQDADASRPSTLRWNVMPTHVPPFRQRCWVAPVYKKDT